MRAGHKYFCLSSGDLNGRRVNTRLSRASASRARRCAIGSAVRCWLCQDAFVGATMVESEEYLHALIGCIRRRFR